jgi:hypothetical protein
MKFRILLLIILNSTLSFGQTEKWIECSKDLSDKQFEKKIQASNYNLVSNSFLFELNKWKLDKGISAETIYQNIIGWNKYPKPKKTGIVIQKHIQLDSVKTVPYYIYIPENYSSDLPTKLLVYYKGGWISRDSFPSNIAKEIINDNPTFSYLDRYNIIEIFPALNRDLAIYGMYGYKHIRLMLADSKKVLNIDDNQVYLAGFSDGGRTVYNLAFLRPTDFASFYSINGSFNNSNMNYPNYTSRPVTTYSGTKDKLVNPKYALSVAETANSFGADWKINTFKGEHFYFPYEKEILPKLFTEISNSNRNPFPNKILYHKDYEYDELKGIDWLHIKTNTERKPENWHYSSEINIIRNEKEIDSIKYGQKTAQVKANYFNNIYDLKTSLVDEVVLYISPTMIDINKPVKVILNGKEVYNQKIGFDKNFMIDNFIEKFDRKQVWINEIKLIVE